MSRTPAFSRGMFDVLAQEGDEEEEVEVEEVEEPKVDSAADSTSTTPSTLSKSAKKRLAKAARAAETSDKVPAPVSNGVKAAEEKVDQNGGIDATAEKATAQVEQLLNAAGEKVRSVVNGDLNGIKEQVSKNVEPVVAKAAQVAEVAAESVSNGLGLSSDNAAGSQDKERRLSRSSDSPRHIGSSFVPPTSQPSSSATKSNGGRKSSFAKPASASPPSSKFQPELPEELPHPKANALPANRKRKQPVDFTPSGPGVDGALSQSSSKMGVKFEDGLVPGQGKDGETTIPVNPKADRNMVERTTWTFIMIGGFIALLCAGHPYMILLVLLCQTLVYKEITALFELRDEGSKKTDVADKWSKTLNWYFFVVTNYFLYGESIIYYFKHIIFVDAVFIPFARNHRFISFMLYVMGFVGFVANLDRRFLRQQFALFCWVHITLLLVVVSSHFIVNNILEGLVWFFIPASLVICNDVMAYICGKTFGKTPLIKLSPKKTVEGFVGAFICTLIFGLAWSTFFMRFNYMICPARDLGTSVFSNVQCRPNPVFIWRDFTITGPIGKIFETVIGRAPPSIPYTPFHIHTLVMATFASLVAPFGGFFASGFKRAFNIKDFGHSIPGHGGMTDRMDCQFMMGLFAYVYYSSLIRIQYVTVGSILQSVVTNLSGPEQLELLTDLRRYLEGQGLKVKA